MKGQKTYRTNISGDFFKRGFVADVQNLQIFCLLWHQTEKQKQRIFLHFCL